MDQNLHSIKGSVQTPDISLEHPMVSVELGVKESLLIGSQSIGHMVE